MYSWPRSAQESTNDRIRCGETAQKEIRTSTADTIKILATPPKNVSHSRLRSKNSSKRGIFRTASETGGPTLRGSTRGRATPCDQNYLRRTAFPWRNERSHNRYLREAREGPVRHPHCDALVIKALVANHNVHRILVERMRLKVSYLKPSPNPVYSFTGDSVIPLGVILLPMTLGEYPR